MVANGSENIGRNFRGIYSIEIYSYLTFKIKIMSPKIKKLYEGLIKNQAFLYAIKVADNDPKPNLFTSEIEKHFYAAAYYGWLVSEYGVYWESNI